MLNMTQTRKRRRLAALMMTGTLMVTQAGAEVLTPEWIRPADGAVRQVLVEQPCHSGVLLYFEVGSAALTRAGSAALDLLAPAIIDHIAEGGHVEIVGHGDMRGREADNFALSGQRALAVVTHLVETWSISPKYLDVQAWGTRDLVTLAAEESAQNRRVEVQLTGFEARSDCEIPTQINSMHDGSAVLSEDWSLDLDDFGGGQVPLSLR